MTVNTAEPTVTDSHANAYKASWNDYAGYFAHGKPIKGNANRRWYKFADGSYSIAQAHVPTLTVSDDSEAVCGALWVLTLSSVIGLVVPAIVMAARPNNKVWQGYNIRFFSATGEQLGKRRYFYGMKRSSSIFRSVTINGSSNPETFENFANHAAAFSWHQWKSDFALIRTADPLVKAIANFDAQHQGSIATTHNSGSAALRSQQTLVQAADQSASLSLA